MTNETDPFVEDDLGLLGGLSFALKRRGYEIETARAFAQTGSLFFACSQSKKDLFGRCIRHGHWQARTIADNPAQDVVSCL